MPLERYRPIIPEFSRFLDTISRPEPTTLRACRAVSRDELARRLDAQGFRTEPVDGLEAFLRVLDGPGPVAHTREHWQGRFYIQQAVTGVAAPVLAPEPGDRVLDMCASPGGKTTHLADLMERQGCLVAGDVTEGRLKGLMGNLTRLLVPNVVTVVTDARRFPEGAEFDRILVDAPCSAEGNLRKKGGVLRRQKSSFLRHVTRLQEAILRRGVSLLRPGGSLLYVTCTFAPEENEAVVSRVLEDAPVRVAPIELPVPSAPGLTRFEGKSYHPDLEGAHRLYPHHLDSGGLFLALLRKAGAPEGPAPGWSPVPGVFPGDSREESEARGWVADGHERLAAEFGVAPARLADLGWIVRGESAWMHACDEWPVPAWEPGDWRISSVGLRGLSPGPRGRARPTNYLLRLAGEPGGERCVEVTAEEAIRLLERAPVDAPPLPPGFVTLELDGSVIGRGSVGASGVRHEIPKARANRLLEILTHERERVPG